MSVRKAAKEVLKSAGKPLHADEITELMISKGLWKTKGKTPAATVSAQLYRDIKKKGEKSDFELVSPQTFTLRKFDIHSQDTDKEIEKAKTLKHHPTKTYSFSDCAVKILEEFGKKNPMHYRVITEKALELGWLTTGGKTPEASMYAQIINEIKRYRRRGEQPRFKQHGKGYIGLTPWMGHGLSFEIEQHNKQVRKELHKRLLNMKWEEFEELIARLLAEIGFEEIEVTNPSKDGGIDVRGTLVIGEVIRTRMAIQVKRWKRNVQSPAVQQVRGSLGAHEQGLIITTSDFSAGAYKEAARSDAIPVGLMNGEQLVVLLVENGLGVLRKSHELLELDETEDFSNENSKPTPLFQNKK